MEDKQDKEDNYSLNAILATTLKKMDASVLSAALKSSKRSRGGDDDDDDDDDERSTKKEQSKKPKANNDTNIEEEIIIPMNEYKGWVVPTKNYNIPKISLDDDHHHHMTPEKFYHDYISQRKPVILQGGGGLDDLDKLKKWKNNNDHLRNLAGEERVMVEVRSNDTDSFGKGNEIAMPFHQFLDLIEQGDTKHYLTTQDVEANEDGQPDLMAPFMKTLKDDFPLRPKIIGNLIPQNLNLWMGNNTEGASSGLHHDYHDNLYVMVRGKKKFRLYSPADTEMMYSRGKLCKVHTNGRINYVGEETTPYGADLQADAAAQASRAKEIAEQRLVDAEKAVEKGLPGAEEELERAEEMLEEAMDALIDIEMGDDGGEDFDEEDEGEENFANFLPDNDSENEESSKESKRIVDKTVKDPNNFSKVSAQILLDETQLNNEFPNMKSAKAAFCELEVGDILYLPASWWHEVTSFSGPEGHLAMNYWFHPPDATNNYKNPYTTEFWPNDYKLRFER